MGSVVIGYGDFRAGSTALLGDLMALLAAAFIAFYFFMGESLRKEMTAVTYSVSAFGGSSLFLLLYALIRGDSLFGYSGGTWMSFLGLAFVSTILGQFVFNALLKWLSATSIATGVLGEPVGTCILAWLVLGEGIETRQWVGMLIILIGLSLYFISSAKKEK